MGPLGRRGIFFQLFDYSRSAGTRVTVTFLSLALVVLGSIGLILWERAQAHEMFDRIMRSHSMIDGAERFISRMKDAETGQRGYLLTEREEYLAPYEVGRVEALVELDALRSGSMTNGRQQVLLLEIGRLAHMKLDELEETVQLVTSDRSRALEIVNTDFGQETMADIRLLIDRFLQEEESLLELYEQAHDRRRKVVTVSVLGAAATLLLALGFFASGMSARVAAPINTLARFANGIRDSVETEPTTRDARDAEAVAVREKGEISTLAQALLEMRDAIAEREQKLLFRTRELEREVQAREDAEQALVHSQKLDAIGQLSGGIAHDFNNLLNVIMGYSEMLKQDLELTEPDVVEFLDGIDIAVLRGAELTQRLLAFSCKQVLVPERVAANNTIDELCSLLAPTFPENIKVEQGLEESLWPVHADGSQLENVLLNLAINARDAMPRGGCLRFTSRNVTLSIEAAAARGCAPGDYVVLAVIDDGVGIRSENLSRVVEPYYTTKGPGGGSGLGLSMAFGFAEQSGGFLSIESTPKVGTRIALFLPRHDQAVTVDRVDIGEPRSTEAVRGEIILLVEDGKELLALYERQLRSLGYGVLAAADAQEALALAEQVDHIDVLLTDAILTGDTNGYELSKKVAEMFPNVRVRFMTGYADTVFSDAFRVGTSVNILRKPFSLAELSTHVVAEQDEGVPA